GLQVETLLAIELGDFNVGLGGLALRALFRIQVANLQPDADVLGVVLDDLQVLLDRLVSLAPFDKLLGGFHDLILIYGHGSRRPPSQNLARSQTKQTILKPTPRSDQGQV